MSEAKTIQQQMRDRLLDLPIPQKEIEVYGSQIVVTCWSRDAADKWGLALAKFAKIRSITKSADYASKNAGSCLRPTMVDVWRVFAVV